MRYVILLILWIITACLSHLQHSNLLSGDPGMVGEYIGSVFLGPLLLPVLVSGILCAFAKKTRVLLGIGNPAFIQHQQYVSHNHPMAIYV